MRALQAKSAPCLQQCITGTQIARWDKTALPVQRRNIFGPTNGRVATNNKVAKRRRRRSGDVSCTLITVGILHVMSASRLSRLTRHRCAKAHTRTHAHTHSHTCIRSLTHTESHTQSHSRPPHIRADGGLPPRTLEVAAALSKRYACINSAHSQSNRQMLTRPWQSLHRILSSRPPLSALLPYTVEKKNVYRGCSTLRSLELPQVTTPVIGSLPRLP